MLGKKVFSIVSLLVILSMIPLVVSAQTNCRRRPNRAIGAGGAGTYVKRNSLVDSFILRRCRRKQKEAYQAVVFSDPLQSFCKNFFSDKPMLTALRFPE